MIIPSFRNLLITALVLACGYLAGCAGVNTFPQKAMGGDTIMLALGSPEGLEKDNIIVNYVPDGATSSVNLTPHIHALFKLYPAPTSGIALETHGNPGLIYEAGHEPWLTTLAINLPFSMPVGTGTIQVDCVPRSSCTFPIFHAHTNDVDIALEILPGEGEPNPFGYLGQFGNVYPVNPQRLEALPQVTVLPVMGGSSSSDVFGAASIELKVPVETATGGSVPDDNIFIIAEDISPDTRSQRQVSWTRSDDDITVMLISPLGMTYQEVRFSVVLRPPFYGSTQKPGVYSGTPTLTTETYYDLDGNVVPSVSSPHVNISLDI